MFITATASGQGEKDIGFTQKFGQQHPEQNIYYIQPNKRTVCRPWTNFKDPVLTSVHQNLFP